jgi:hypothetical protein
MRMVRPLHFQGFPTKITPDTSKPTKLKGPLACSAEFLKRTIGLISTAIYAGIFADAVDDESQFTTLGLVVTVASWWNSRSAR